MIISQVRLRYVEKLIVLPICRPLTYVVWESLTFQTILFFQIFPATIDFAYIKA